MLSNHVALTDERIAYRFTVEKRPAVSCFASAKEAEGVIGRVLHENGHKIDNWLKTARKGAKLEVEGRVSEEGAFIVRATDRERRRARSIQIVIVNEVLNGLVYYIHTFRLY
ncbi:RNase A-like domain-containing protein [Acetobacter fabarum]|uniref:RNase A-like domain-containing protein n=1 Tax=Acetobacter fabarum TaxID=483199 RepID=UPI0039E8EC48